MNEEARIRKSGEVRLSVVMGARTGLSANAIACWARHLLLYNCELFSIHHSRLFYPAIALTSQAFEAVVAVWIVSWHIVAPF